MELDPNVLDPNVDDRKSAALVARGMKTAPGIERVSSFGFARELLRNEKLKQDGGGAEGVDFGNPDHVPVFFLDGEKHHARRAAIMKFFMAKAINTRLLSIMESTTERLLQDLQRQGTGKLDVISFELAAAVAAEIVGLGEADITAMSHRLATFLRLNFSGNTGVRGAIDRALGAFYATWFHVADVLPAVRKRRIKREEDVISQVIDKGYSSKSILIECMTYASAGMVTTREFIVMAAWHMFDRPELRERFVSSDEDVKMHILGEILRLDPPAAIIRRRASEDVQSAFRGCVNAEAQFAVDIRGVHSDEALVGACPHALDPDRARKLNQNGTYMSFGDGPHRCPGWQVALKESCVFLDRLLRVPGIRLERAPEMRWNQGIGSYELRDAIIVCDKV